MGTIGRESKTLVWHCVVCGFAVCFDERSGNCLSNQLRTRIARCGIKNHWLDASVLPQMGLMPPLPFCLGQYFSEPSAW